MLPGAPITEVTALELVTTHTTENGWDVLAVSGEVDLATAKQLEDDIAEHVDADCRLCLDLTGVGFMDSTGLRVLIGALKAVEDASGQLRVVAGDGAVFKLLGITGLHDRLDLYDSVAAATGS